MKVDEQAKRLKAVKDSHVWIIPMECDMCHGRFVNEKMWKVKIRSPHNLYDTVFVCKHCAPSKEDVIDFVHEHYKFGIWGVYNIRPGEFC